MWRPCVDKFIVSLKFTARQILAPAENVQHHSYGRRWTSNVRITKELKKMLERGGKSKKKIFSVPVNVNSVIPEDLNTKRKPIYTEGQKRRAHQIGHVLYDAIVQIVNSGQLSPKLASMSVDIVRVKVVPNFSAVNVYWLSSGSVEDEEIERLLKVTESSLRQHLISLHVLGNIPRITFVRDDSRAHYLEVERLLSQADFGPDFVPTKLDTAIREIAYVTGKEKKQSIDEKLLEELKHMGLADSQQCSEILQTMRPKLGESVGDPAGTAKTIENLSTMAEDRAVVSDGDNVLDGPPVEAYSAPSCSLQSGEIFYPDRDATSLQTSASMPPAPLDGFRDDLYGVSHASLMKKILLKKHKYGFLPIKKENEEVVSSQAETASQMVSKFKVKKLYKHGRSKPQSDYDYLTGEAMLSHSESYWESSFKSSDIDDEADIVSKKK